MVHSQTTVARSISSERVHAADEVAVAFGIDGGYAPHAAAVIASILRAAPGARFRFILLYDGVAPERRAAVEAAAPGHRFDWVEIGDDDVPAFFQRDHFTRAILYRLGLEKLAPADCSRVIYLDSDVIVLSDIRELWASDLGGCALGAVEDPFEKADEFAARWGLPFDGQRYFNSGVLLIDLDRVREERLFATAMEFVARNDREVRFSDQDALNFALWGRWRPLPTKWNAQRINVIASISEGLPEDKQFHRRVPGVVHFVGPEKPWVATGFHPWSWIYWDNLARTPFFHDVARTEGVGRLRRFKLWLRWLRWRPIGG